MTKEQTAYITPFAVFMLLLGANPVVRSLLPSSAALLAGAPEQIIFPLQTFVCGVLLLYFWRCYQLGPVIKITFTLALAFCTFVIWISPQTVFHAQPRLDGFDPTIWAPNQTLVTTVLAVRFVRLVVVVPLVEEIFWRGFLLRDLIDRDFEKVPFGAYSRFSFITVTLLFAAAHWGNGWMPGPDFIPAVITGAIFNYVAYQTRSLGSCVVVHAVTNLLLGFYIVRTGQWGFW